MKQQKAVRMNNRRRAALLTGIVLILLFFVAVLVVKQDILGSVRSEYTQAVIAGHSFTLRVADTIAEQERGLSGTDSLDPNEGMLFVFKDRKERAVWMKEMEFPIDVIWLELAPLSEADIIQTPSVRARYKVVGTTSELVPESYPATFRSGNPVDAFLEIPAGMVNQLSVVVGQEINIY